MAKRRKGSAQTRQLEVTPINRQSYMAEISSLLGLITDEHTREVLIAKMEHMFDAADDEQKLIHDIGSPTKVAVALIRYADNGVVTPEAAAVIDSVTDDELEQEAEFETLEALDEQPELLIPESEAAPEVPETEEVPEVPEVEEAPVIEEEPEAPAVEEAPEAPVPEAEPEIPEAETEPEVEVEEKTEVPEAPAVSDDEPLDLFEVLTGRKQNAPAVEEAPAPAPVEAPEAPVEAPAAGGFFAAPADLDAVHVDAPVEEAPAEESTFVEDALPEQVSVEEMPAEEPVEKDLPLDVPSEIPEDEDDEDDEDEPLTVTKVNTFLAILYFIIPGLVIGLPVFLALVVLNLAFLVAAAAVLGTAVLLVITGLSPLARPDRLLCFGGAAAALAVGLVLLWFTIWFLICVTSGWIRLMTRGGKRVSRKEVEIV